MTDLERIKQGVIEGDMPRVKELTAKALTEGAAPLALLRRALIPAMNVVGERMRTGEFFVPEVLLAARAMKAAMEIIKPLVLESRAYEPTGRIIIGTVQGDMHDIGKNLVVTMLEGAGFEVADLGVDVSPERFVEAVREKKPDILAMSALLTTTMGQMAAVMKALSDAGCRQRLKVIVGGAPLSPRFARDISADGYAEDAGAAAELAKGLVASRRAATA
ncbi:MAG: corrinoid protein [Chloroflexi bacterium]|nr:corrinoid protein [Chloroflexota bacterium]